MVAQSNLVAFIIGAGSHIGAAVAAQLHANGYKVALGSRSADVGTEGPFFRVKVDVSQRETIDIAFDAVVAELGPINVVVYNAASLTVPPTENDPLSLAVEEYYDSISIGLGVFVAAKKALTSGFQNTLHQTNPKVFIVTGNMLPFSQYTPPTYFTLGSQKAVAARLIATAAKSYSADNIQYYFATLVSSEGMNPSPEEFEKSAPAHARVFMELIKSEKQGHWDHRFTIDSKTYPHLTSD